MLHPTRGDSLTEIERFLWRFRMVAHEAQVMLRGLHNTADVARDINHDLLFSLCNQALLVVSKFLEVWDSFGSLSKTESRVVDARRAIQPIVSRIRIWPGIEHFRNTALAHPYLTKSGELVGPWTLIAEHKAPTYHAEYVLLLFLVDSAVLALLACFLDEYAPLRPLLRSPIPAPDAGRGITLGTEIAPAHEQIAAEVNANLRRLGVGGADELLAEFRDARTRQSRSG